MSSPLKAIYEVAAPAKLNLFLHITGRRADGYHLLQSAFMLIDWCDTLHFELRNDGHIQREEAVALVKRFDGEFPAKHFDEFLAYTGLSAEEFHRIADAWRGQTAWTKSGDAWKLTKPVWEAT